MWVVKIGGSLGADPLLLQWLELLVQLGGGRVTVVCGGGTFADEVRRVQAQWDFDDLAAHNMAVLAMAQTAYQLHALNPALHLALRESDIARVLRKGHTALWLPLELQREVSAQLGAAGVVDQQFAALSDGADFPIDIIHKTELARIRALLLDDVRFVGSS